MNGLRLGAALLLAGTFQTFTAQGAFAESTKSDTEYNSWFEMLDSNSCQRRTTAWNFLCAEAESEKNQGELLTAVRNHLLEAETSFEVQSSLEKLEAFLLEKMDSEEVEMAEKKAQSLSPALPSWQAECWKKLTSNSYPERNIAERQLKERLQNPGECCEILHILRNLLLSEDLAADDMQRIHNLEQLARFRWLKLEETERITPDFTLEQLREWVDFLAAEDLPEDLLVPWMNLDERTAVRFSVRPGVDPLGGDGFGFLVRGISREEKEEGLKIWKTVRTLEDALVCEKTSVHTYNIIAEKLASRDVTPSGTILLKRLAFLMKPCLAAEYWLNGEMEAAQFLQVGVPQDCGQNLRTCFDSLDEKYAHCSMGTNLAPGNYPLNAAVLHPKQETAFFHFVPLKTPREKLLYVFLTRENPSERWCEISRDSLGEMELRCEEEHRFPSDSELKLMEILEPHEVSRQIGKWFVMFREKEKRESKNTFREKMLASEAAFCSFLFRNGTKEAVPGLMQVLSDDSIRSDALVLSVRIAYAAAFSIAVRDPWENTDTWLISALEKNVPLFETSQKKDESPMQMASASVGKSKNWGETRIIASVSPSASFSSSSGGAFSEESPIPTISATAAGILLKRKKIADFSGLEEVQIPMMVPQKTELDFYRYSNDAVRLKYTALFTGHTESENVE